MPTGCASIIRRRLDKKTDPCGKSNLFILEKTVNMLILPVSFYRY